MKTKKFSLNWAFGSALITIFLAYVLPCRYVDELNKVFGFPFAWFFIHNDTIGDRIINSTAVSLIPYLLDVALFYFVIWGLFFIYKKFIDTNRTK